MEWKELLCPERRGIDAVNALWAKGRDFRTEYEKDYDHIIASASFRRLQDKTQVFPLDKSDFIRTRLTHSLEVSSIAKSLAQNISRNMMASGKDPNYTWETADAVGSVVQCAGLIHDIGNPPFGHFGETAIRQWFQDNLDQLIYFDRNVKDMLTPQMMQDFLLFEGNAQALRLVTKLHFSTELSGMNLTYAVLSTILKYTASSITADSHAGNIKYKKMGYFYADQDVYEEIQEKTGTHGCRNPMTYILEAADDIAYKTADIEDAVKKGCITYSMLERELGHLNCSGEKRSKDYFDPLKELQKRYSNTCDMESTLQNEYNRGIRLNNKDLEFYVIQNWALSVKNYLIKCATHGFMEHYDEIMAGTYEHDLFYGTYGEGLEKAMSDIAYRNAFVSEPIYKLEISAGHMLNFLLDKFVKAAMYFDTDKELGTIDDKLVFLISNNYVQRYYMDSKNKTEEEKLYLRLLLATDLVCGMTDSYAQGLYQELNGIRS